MNPADETILEELQKEFSPRLFAMLVSRWSPQLHQVISRYIQEPESVKDLVQETFVRIFTNLSKYQPGQPAGGWFRTLAINLALDDLRRQKRMPLRELSRQLADTVADMAEWEGEISEEQRFNAMMATLEATPAADKMLLLLKYRERQSVREIAQAMQLGESNVKMRLKRAKDRLRAQLLKAGQA